jgi:hypothetical protein
VSELAAVLLCPGEKVLDFDNSPARRILLRSRSEAQMGRYDPLQRHLAGVHGIEVELSFEAMERILGTSLPKAAARAQWWRNSSDSASARRPSSAWTEAGFNAALVDNEQRVRFLRQGYKVVSRSEGITVIAKENPSEEEIAKGTQAWENLIKLLARTAADVCHREGSPVT